MSGQSLRQRALAALARREHSRIELTRKLAPYAEDPGEIETLLNQLEADKLLSNTRFAESLARRRSERYGAMRVQLELAQHQLPAAELSRHVEELRQTELARCRAVWLKKFGQLPDSLVERARQSRFLLGRGFNAAAVQRVLKGDELD